MKKGVLVAVVVVIIVVVVILLVSGGGSAGPMAPPPGEQKATPEANKEDAQSAAQGAATANEAIQQKIREAQQAAGAKPR